jgi:hypothetical protein
MMRGWGLERWGSGSRGATVRAAAQLPGVQAVETAGHASFSVSGKHFAWLLVDHHGDGRLALHLKAPPGGQGGRPDGVLRS